MKVKRGVISYTFEEHMEAALKEEYINDHYQATFKVLNYLEVLGAQFDGSYFQHSFNLIETSLIDYFLSKITILEYENIQYLHDDLCGWRHGEFINYLKSENVDLNDFKYKYLKYSDFCFELFSYKQKNGLYILTLPNETKVDLNEADFFALSILSFNYIQPTDYKEDGYWFDSPKKALEKWDSLPPLHKESLDIYRFYDKTVHTEYWFSIINELFTYFQNALIRNGEKIAISKEKSRLAKIKAEKYQQNNKQAFKDIEELWETGQWSKASKCAEDIFNIQGIELPYNTVYNHLRAFIKSKK